MIQKSINENNFSQAALIYSISDTSTTGGDIGWVKETTINKKILNFINKLKINDYSKPILVPGGFLILKIKDKRELNTDNDLEKELKVLIEKTQNQQLSQYSIIYFNKVKKDISINEL